MTDTKKNTAEKKETIISPDEPAITPAEILPIMAEGETNAAGEEIDTSNNYTAAENDHDTNATI
jgi:hypothetical protein